MSYEQVHPGVYAVSGREGFEGCMPTHRGSYELIDRLLAGESASSEWSPVEVAVVDHERGVRLHASDAPWWGSHALVFMPNAVSALGQLLQQHGELLPLRCETKDVSLFYCRHLLDALDEEASDVIRFSSGRIMSINRFRFRADALRGAAMFRLASLRVSPTYVTHAFVEAWKAGGLVGLDFDLKWSSCD